MQVLQKDKSMSGGASFTGLSSFPSGLHFIRGELKSISWKMQQKMMYVMHFVGCRNSETCLVSSVIKNTTFNIYTLLSLIEAEDIQLISYLSTKSFTGNGFDQVGGVGKVDENLLIRLQSRSRGIHQQHLRKERQTFKFT